MKGERSIYLSRRERQVAFLVWRKKLNKQIALELGIAPQTVRNHLGTIFTKTGCHDRTALYHWLDARIITDSLGVVWLFDEERIVAEGDDTPTGGYYCESLEEGFRTLKKGGYI